MLNVNNGSLLVSGLFKFFIHFKHIFLIQINYVCVVFIYKKANTISFGWSKGMGQGVKQGQEAHKKKIH